MKKSDKALIALAGIARVLYAIEPISQLLGASFEDVRAAVCLNGRSPSSPVAATDTSEQETYVEPAAEVGGCKALLLEIVRRAAYDWVLYRTHSVINKRRLADDAYTWLFVEGPGHPAWTERCNNKKQVTGFLSICEALELDPSMVRGHIRRLTVENVMSIGRPAEYRRQEWRDSGESYSAPAVEGSGDSIYDDLAPFDGLSEE